MGWAIRLGHTLLGRESTNLPGGRLANVRYAAIATKF